MKDDAGLRPGCLARTRGRVGSGPGWAKLTRVDDPREFVGWLGPDQACLVVGRLGAGGLLVVLAPDEGLALVRGGLLREVGP